MATPLAPESVIVAASRQISTAFDDEVVILGLHDSVYYGLSHVGSRVWALLQSPRSIREVVDTIVAEYAVAPADAARDIHALVAQLHAHGLVELQTPARG